MAMDVPYIPIIPPWWHKSISLTGMLVQAQIWTTLKSRMTLNSNSKNRITQDGNLKKKKKKKKSGS